MLAGIGIGTLIMAGITAIIDAIARNLTKGGPTSGLIDMAIGSNNLNDMLKLLCFSGMAGVNTSSIWSTYWKILDAGFEAIRPFGIALISTFFIIHMYDVATKEQMTVDSLIKSLMGLVLAIGIVGNINIIINTVLSIGDGLLIKLNSVITLNIDSNKIQAMYSSHTATELLLQALGLYIVHQIVVIAVDVVAISRAIELGWRIIVSPIACSNAFEGGMNSPAVKFIKSILAVVIQGPVMYVVAALGYSIVYGIYTFNDSGLGFFASVAAMFATTGAIVAVGNKVKEVVA